MTIRATISVELPALCHQPQKPFNCAMIHWAVPEHLHLCDHHHGLHHRRLHADWYSWATSWVARLCFFQEPITNILVPGYCICLEGTGPHLKGCPTSELLSLEKQVCLNKLKDC